MLFRKHFPLAESLFFIWVQRGFRSGDKLYFRLNRSNKQQIFQKQGIKWKWSTWLKYNNFTYDESNNFSLVLGELILLQF